MKIASWNVNSIRARLDHVIAWLKLQRPDVLLMQELKGTDFPAEVFKELGYESVAVTQKAYNGVAVLSRHPIETVSTTLAGDETDSHARYLEMTIEGIRVVNIYLPNGNPVGSGQIRLQAGMDGPLVQGDEQLAGERFAGVGRRGLQCYSGGHRLPQAVIVDP